MNPSNNKPGPRSQFKPQVAQAKFRVIQKSPAAPLAYRPQPVPKVLQLKRHEVGKPRATVETQNVARASNLAAQPKVAPKTAAVQRSNVHQHQPVTVKPSCVQAKTNSSLRNAWSIRKPLPGNI